MPDTLNEAPRSKLRGIKSVEQARLLDMELRIFFITPLLLDIVANRIFSAMLPNRTDKIAVTPELAAPQFLFDAGDTCQDFAGRQAFDDSYHLGWTVTRDRLYQKMHMVPIRADFQKDDFVALGNIQTHRRQHLIDFFTNDDSSVFSWAYDMV